MKGPLTPHAQSAAIVGLIVLLVGGGCYAIASE